MTEIATFLQTFGGWGISVALFYICARLYKDLRETERARLDEAKEFGNKANVALNEAIQIVRAIRGEIVEVAAIIKPRT